VINKMLENINFTEDQLAAMSLLLSYLKSQINSNLSFQDIENILSDLTLSLERTKSLCRLNSIGLKWELNDHRPLVAGGAKLTNAGGIFLFEEHFIIQEKNEKYEVFVCGTKEFKEILIEVSSFAEACETILLEYKKRQGNISNSISDWSFSQLSIDKALEIINWANQNKLKIIDFTTDVVGGIAVHLQGNNELTCWIAILNNFDGKITAITSVISSKEKLIRHSFYGSVEKEDILKILVS